MKTREFLKKYAYVYLYAACVCLLISHFIGSFAQNVSNLQTFSATPAVIIDAGHGGIDGGTTSCTGVKESHYNLEISQKLERILALLGYHTIMVRTDDRSVATEGTTIREQKRSDLRNRVDLVNSTKNAYYVSIHQNFYPESRYSGPQVFYAGTTGSRELAELLQINMNQALTASGKRTCKKSDGVYIMQHINCPGVLIECGFLSNPEEEKNLRSPEYQNKVCAVIAASLAQYFEKIPFSSVS